MHPPLTSPTQATPTAPRRVRRALRFAAPVVACVALGTLATACGGSGDEVADNAADELAEQLAEAGAGQDADVDIDSESGQVDVSTPDGDMSFGEGTELPDDFPSEIPLPADYQLNSAMSTSTDGSDGWTISGELPGATSDTFDELVAAFTDAGWTTTSDSSSETGGGTASTAMLDDGTWQVILSVQVGVEGMPDSFSYLVSSSAG
jgi:hypothetical protein